ncbi:transferase [Aspergillus aurantiobrunneus]
MPPLRSFASLSSSTGRQYSVFDFPELGNGLLAPWDMSLEGAQRDPVFTIQRTKFACSAVAIGMRLSHVVSGAGGFLGLYQVLAEIYRATDTAHGRRIELTSPPYLQPFMVTHMLHMNSDQRIKALSERPAAYSVRDPKAAESSTGTGSHSQQESSKSDPLVGRSLRFSSSAIATLKSQAVDPENSSARTSAFTALSAHFWQHTHLARLAQIQSGSNEGQQQIFSSSVFGTSVDFVPHLGLAPRSFGNIVVTPVVKLDSKELAQASLWKIADIINGHIRHVFAEETHKLGSWIAAQATKSHIQLDFPWIANSFIATGWHRFPLYSGADLDVAPIFASPVLMECLFDGMIVFVESKAKDGGLEAIASMKRSTWESPDKDEKFINTWGRRS